MTALSSGGRIRFFCVVAHAKPCSHHVKQASLPHHIITDRLVAMETTVEHKYGLELHQNQAADQWDKNPHI